MAAMQAVIAQVFSIEDTADSAENKSTLEPTQQLPPLLHRVKSRFGGSDRGLAAPGARVRLATDGRASADPEAKGTVSSFAGARRCLDPAPS